MKNLWFLWVIFFLHGSLFPSGVSIVYDPGQIHYQGKIYKGVEFVGLEACQESYLEITRRLDPELLDYATGMIWPQMPVCERQQFLEDLIILDQEQIELLASFEEQAMFPETMHPSNRIKVIQRVRLYGFERVSQHLLEVLNFQETASKEKEADFAQVLHLSDLYPKNNGFLDVFLGGLEEVDYPGIICAFQKAKLSNMRAGLCASLLIDVMMPVSDRIDILERISCFSDGENAVLLNTHFAKTFQDMPYIWKMRLLKELSTDSRSVIIEKIGHIASERAALKGKGGRRKITLAPL